MSVNHKVLFITLSNIGDAILTLPVLDKIFSDNPGAKVTVLCSERSKEVFAGNPLIDRIVVFDKSLPPSEKVKFFRKLRSEDFDTVVDLRNSLLGVLLPARLKTSPFLRIPGNVRHMRDKHLYKNPNPSRQGGIPQRITQEAGKSQHPKQSLYIAKQDEEYIDKILKENNIGAGEKFIVVSPGARNLTKRWGKEGFISLIPRLSQELGLKTVLVGDKDEVELCAEIEEKSGKAALNLCGRTTIPQLGALLRKSSLLITNDSATLHLGSYLDVPVVAIFGPTDDEKYGPWSTRSRVVCREVFCRPCRKSGCRFNSIDCMRLIKPEDVLNAAKEVFSIDYRLSTIDPKVSFKRILLIRTDRIGDVLLSTPVIKAMRKAYPNSYIAFAVSKYAKEIVEGNPNLDEVIVFDKDSQHKGLAGAFKFARLLRKKRFDLALILHPTDRVHLITFLSGIKKRVGYDRNLGFLLTDRIKHEKQLGEKHESQYALDLARYVGIAPDDLNLYMPVSAEAQSWAEEFLEREGVYPLDKLLAIHPGASCPSKIWPLERFARAADKLSAKYGFKVLVVSGPADKDKAGKVIDNMKAKAINLAGKTSVTQLAAVLKRCALFISNDSGPVHLAVAVGTPVISIFGRNQAGLSPKRWGPLGKGRALHREVGCICCLAHNCEKEFACLKAITVDDVVSAASELLGLKT